MHRNNIRRITPEEYTAQLHQFPSHSPFSSFAWFDYWSDLDGNRSVETYAIEVRGKEIPLAFCRKNSLLPGQSIMECAPMNVFGAVPLSSSLEESVAEIIAQEFPSTLVSFSPNFDSSPSLDKNLPFFTHAVTFSERNWIESLPSSKRNSLMRKVKKAQSAGILVRKAEDSDWADFYGLYTKNIERWKSGTRHIYSEDEILSFGTLDSDFAQLWVSELDEKVIGGALCFCSTSVCSYWLGASDADYFELRSNNLLFFELLNYYQTHGTEVFDFGPSPGLKGVQQFKESFGAQKFAYRRLEQLSPILRAALKTKSALNSMKLWLK